MNNVQTRSLLHTHARSLRRGLYTHTHNIWRLCARADARQHNRTREMEKRTSGGKQSVLPLPLRHQSSDEKQQLEMEAAAGRENGG